MPKTQEYAREYAKKWREEHKEETKLYNSKREAQSPGYKKAYRDANKEKIALEHKAYYEANKEKIALYYKTYNADKGYQRNYRETHRVQRNISDQKREARKKLLPNTLTEIQWKNIKYAFNNSCAYCGNEVQLVQEHFVALSKGGEYTRDNIIPSCKPCNSSKHDSVFSVWYHKQPYYDKDRESIILKHLGYKKQKQQLSIF